MSIGTDLEVPMLGECPVAAVVGAGVRLLAGVAAHVDPHVCPLSEGALASFPFTPALLFAGLAATSRLVVSWC